MRRCSYRTQFWLQALSGTYRYSLRHDRAVVALASGFTGNSRNVGTGLSFLSAVLMSYFLYIPQSFRANARALLRIGHDRFLPDRLHFVVPIFRWFAFIVTASENNEPKAFSLPNVDEDIQVDPIYC